MLRIEHQASRMLGKPMLYHLQPFPQPPNLDFLWLEKYLIILDLGIIRGGREREYK
jgi:hypothetical protein